MLTKNSSRTRSASKDFFLVGRCSVFEPRSAVPERQIRVRAHPRALCSSQRSRGPPQRGRPGANKETSASAAFSSQGRKFCSARSPSPNRGQKQNLKVYKYMYIYIYVYFNSLLPTHSPTRPSWLIHRPPNLFGLCLPPRPTSMSASIMCLFRARIKSFGAKSFLGKLFFMCVVSWNSVHKQLLQSASAMWCRLSPYRRSDHFKVCAMSRCAAARN